MTYKTGRLPHPFPRHGVQTTVEWHSSDLFVTYRGTTVLKVDKERRTITFRSNGWNTRTTKRRINDGLAYAGIQAHIYQRNWKWYLVRSGYPDIIPGADYPYPYDGSDLVPSYTLR